MNPKRRERLVEAIQAVFNGRPIKKILKYYHEGGLNETFKQIAERFVSYLIAQGRYELLPISGKQVEEIWNWVNKPILVLAPAPVLVPVIESPTPTLTEATVELSNDELQVRVEDVTAQKLTRPPSSRVYKPQRLKRIAFFSRPRQLRLSKRAWARRHRHPTIQPEVAMPPPDPPVVRKRRGRPQRKPSPFAVPTFIVSTTVASMRVPRIASERVARVGTVIFPEPQKFFNWYDRRLYRRMTAVQCCGRIPNAQSDRAIALRMRTSWFIQECWRLDPPREIAWRSLRLSEREQSQARELYWRTHFLEEDEKMIAGAMTGGDGEELIAIRGRWSISQRSPEPTIIEPRTYLSPLDQQRFRLIIQRWIIDGALVSTVERELKRLSTSTSESSEDVEDVADDGEKDFDVERRRLWLCEPGLWWDYLLWLRMRALVLTNEQLTRSMQYLFLLNDLGYGYPRIGRLIDVEDISTLRVELHQLRLPQFLKSVGETDEIDGQPKRRIKITNSTSIEEEPTPEDLQEAEKEFEELSQESAHDEESSDSDAG